MTRVAHHEFTPDESAVLHRKQLGVDITGRVEEWACHHCGNRDFVWV